MQMDPTGVPSSTAIQQTQPTTQETTDIKMAIPLPARELERPWERGASRAFVNPVCLSSFFNTRIPLRELVWMMLNLRHVLQDLESASRSQTSVDDLLQPIANLVVAYERGEQTAATVLCFSPTEPINGPR